MNNKIFRVNTPDVTSKVMDGEAIIIDLSTGIYYSIDDVGALIWKGIEDGRSQNDILQLMVNAFDVAEETASADLARLLGELEAAGLTVPADSATEPAAAAETRTGGAKADYQSPQINRYEDMAELFALDPPLPDVRKDA
ncbi:MAG: PqqD family protein [Alphaproteobacteria bacterium]